MSETIPKPKRTYKKRVPKIKVTDTDAIIAATSTATSTATPAATPAVTADVIDATPAATSAATADVTSVTTKHTTLPAKYEKFILYGIYLINSIQSSNTPILSNNTPGLSNNTPGLSNNTPIHSNSFEIAHAFHTISEQTRFIDQFFIQFKDIKSSYKNILKSRKNNLLHQSLTSNTKPTYSNTLSVQIIEIEHIKYFITQDNRLLDFHTQLFVRNFIT